MSVKLWKCLCIGNHGAWPPKANRSSEFRGEKVEVEGNGVVVEQIEVEVRDIRVLARGRIKVLRAPNPILVQLRNGCGGRRS